MQKLTKELFLSGVRFKMNNDKSVFTYKYVPAPNAAYAKQFGRIDRFSLSSNYFECSVMDVNDKEVRVMTCIVGEPVNITFEFDRFEVVEEKEVVNV